MDAGQAGTRGGKDEWSWKDVDWRERGARQYSWTDPRMQVLPLACVPPITSSSHLKPGSYALKCSPSSCTEECMQMLLTA